MKKILSIVLAAVLLLALAACGGGNSNSPAPAANSPAPADNSPAPAANSPAPAANSPAPAANSPAPAANSPAPADNNTPAAPAALSESYTFSFAIFDPQGSTFDKYVVEPFQNLLSEKSGGKITLEVFYGASLTGQGATFEAIKNGVVDFGVDTPGTYPGQYLYNELITTPGFNYGGHENFTRILNEYMKTYLDPVMDAFIPVACFAFGNFGIATTSKPVQTVDDVRGMIVRTTTQVIPWYEGMGASATFMPSPEVYEAMRLNVLDGAHTSMGSLEAFRWAEICDYFTFLPMMCGNTDIYMSKDLYNSLPADVQAVLDAVFAEMTQVGIDYAIASQEITRAYCEQTNTNFQFLEVTDATGFIDAAQPLIQAKVAELNAAGLDGTGAYEWLMAKTGG